MGNLNSLELYNIAMPLSTFTLFHFHFFTPTFQLTLQLFTFTFQKNEVGNLNSLYLYNIAMTLSTFTLFCFHFFTLTFQFTLNLFTLTFKKNEARCLGGESNFIRTMPLCHCPLLHYSTFTFSLLLFNLPYNFSLSLLKRMKRDGGESKFIKAVPCQCLGMQQ